MLRRLRVVALEVITGGFLACLNATVSTQVEVFPVIFS